MILQISVLTINIFLKMLQNMRYANFSAHRQLSQRIHTNEMMVLGQTSRSPNRFRVTNKVSILGQKNIRSQANSPNRHNNKPILSTKYMRLQKSNKTSPNRVKVNGINDIIEKKPSTQRSESIKKYQIRTRGISGENYSKSQRKYSQKQYKQTIKDIVGEAHNFARESAEKSNNKGDLFHKTKTNFEEEQMKKYPVYYKGTRSITNKENFTDKSGNALIKIGDAIAYRYEIICELGHGAFGQVYKAIDHKKNQTVALKIIRSIPKLHEQSKVEIEILQKIRAADPTGKSNFIQIKGSFIFRGHPCITYQLLKINLYQYLKINRFEPTEEDVIVKFAIQLLNGLKLTHKLGIVHCDIKPENIMLKEKNKTGLKIIDVGSGCFTEKQMYTYIQSRYYRAPEVILGVKYTPAIDMWSFGCVIAELFMGYPIFPGQNQQQQLLMFMEILGVPPKQLLQMCSRRKKFFNDNFECRILQSPQKIRLPKTLTFEKILGIKENKNLINFMKRCLQWDPTKRMKPKQGLLHEWILDNLPANIRTRHIIQINSQQ